MVCVWRVFQTGRVSVLPIPWPHGLKSPYYSFRHLQFFDLSPPHNTSRIRGVAPPSWHHFFELGRQGHQHSISIDSLFKSFFSAWPQHCRCPCAMTLCQSWSEKCLPYYTGLCQTIQIQLKEKNTISAVFQRYFDRLSCLLIYKHTYAYINKTLKNMLYVHICCVYMTMTMHVRACNIYQALGR